MQTSISGEKFNIFLRALGNLTDDFDDVIIKNGVFRARRNDKYMTGRVDFTNITNFDLPLVGVKNKLKLLRCFKGSETIYLEVDEEADQFSFSDESTKLSFKYLIDEDLVNNKPMTEEELNTTMGIDERNKIIETEISRDISTRIKKISSNFGVDNIQMLFDGTNVKLRLKDTNQSANFAGNIECSEEYNGKANLVVKPFIMDSDGPINMSIYKSQRVENLISMRCDMVVTDKKETANVEMSFYSKTKIIQN